MTALRAREISDILPATGKAGMNEAASEKFWTWRRILLAAGYGLVFLAGLPILFASDPNGLVLMGAAVAGVLFLHRTWVGVVVWAYAAASGVVALTSGDDTGFFGVVAGLAFGALALPWRPRSRAAKPMPYFTQQPAFIPPPTPFLAPQAVVAKSAPVTPAADPVIVPQTEPISALKPTARSRRNGHTGGDPTMPGALFIEAIGKISLTLPWRDLTPDLMRRPVLGFLWLYLFAREMRQPGDRITRTALIDEIAHGVADPRQRLRGYLRDLSHLPIPLGYMIKVEDELISFDLFRQETDVDELRKTAAAFKQEGSKVDEHEIQHAQELLPALGNGDFLPGFEDMEKRVTKGRGIAGQVVADVRAHLHTLRGDVAIAVANALLDRGQSADAVALLEPIMTRSEERDDVARTLITALRESGQHSRAAELRRRFVADQEK